MSASDPFDIERLELFLDGELSTDAAAALKNAAEGDVAMAQALEGLRAERHVRSRYFAALEPHPLEAASMASDLLARVRKLSDISTRRAAIAEDAAKPMPLDRRPGGWTAAAALRWVSAVAAALLCFVAGWMSHVQPVSQHKARPPELARVEPVVDHSGTHAAVETLYQVALTDGSGHVTAVQSFNSLHDARQFADDVSRWHQQEQRVRANAPIVVADRF